MATGDGRMQQQPTRSIPPRGRPGPSSKAPSAMLRVAAALVGGATAASADFQPMLFMDQATDALDPWGLQLGAPSALVKNGSLAPPPCNYSAGATVFAAFSMPENGGQTESFEVFVAIGRPGEPLLLQHGGSGAASSPAEHDRRARADCHPRFCCSPNLPPPALESRKRIEITKCACPSQLYPAAAPHRRRPTRCRRAREWRSTAT